MKHNLLLALLLLPGVAGALDTLQLRSSISEVTLFFTGAQITRTAELQLPAGETLVLLKGLSKHLQPSSLQVSGLGEVTLLSLRSALLEETGTIDKVAEAILRKQEKELKAAMYDLKQELSVYEHEEKIILQNSSLEQSRTNAVQTLREGADFYRQRLLELRRTRTALARRIEQRKEELQAVYVQLNRLQPAPQPAVQALYLHLKATKPHKQKLILKYFDEAAGWSPSYEFRVKSIGQAMEIVYQAQMHQFGGEDWKSVPITLSTANPFLSSSKPELKVWILGRNLPGMLVEGKAPEVKTFQQRTGGITGMVVEDVKPRDGGIPFANVVLLKNDQVVGGTTSDIDGNYKFTQLQPGTYDLKVSYVGFNPAIMKGIYVQAGREQRINIKMSSAVDLSVIEVMDYEVPLISKDETSTGATYTRSDIVPSGGGGSINIRGSRATAHEYFIDGIRVRGNASVTGNGLMAMLEEVLSKSDVLLDYPLEGKQTLLSDGEEQLVPLKKVEVPARFVYHLVPRVSKEAFLTAEIDQFGQLQLLDGPASVYYQGTYIGKTQINTSSLSDTLLVGLGRDPSVQAIRVQQRDVHSKRLLGSQVRQELAAQIVVRSSKEVAVQVVVEDQIPLAPNADILIESHSQPAAELFPEKGLQRWKLELPAGGKLELQQSVFIRYRATN